MDSQNNIQTAPETLPESEAKTLVSTQNDNKEVEVQNENMEMETEEGSGSANDGIKATCTYCSVEDEYGRGEVWLTCKNAGCGQKFKAPELILAPKKRMKKLTNLPPKKRLPKEGEVVVGDWLIGRRS